MPYIGEKGWVIKPINTEDGTGGRRDPIMTEQQSFSPFYSTLSRDTKKMIRAYRFIKKQMLSGKEVYSNGKTYE
jgi:hypothetical protein